MKTKKITAKKLEKKYNVDCAVPGQTEFSGLVEKSPLFTALENSIGKKVLQVSIDTKGISEVIVKR